MERRWDRLHRRRFVLGAGVAGMGLLAGCGRLPWQTQPPAKIPRIGYLAAVSAAADAPRLEAFRQGLRGLGYIEGQSITIDYRHEYRQLDRLPAIAAELVRLEPDVLVAVTTNAAQAARNATTTIPVIFMGVTDPIAAGLVDTLPRPGGNSTGITNMAAVLTGKRLQLLKDTRKRSGPPSAAATALAPRAAPRYNRGMSVMLLPLAAEPAATTPAPDLAPLLEELATLRLENGALRAESAVLHERIRELEARLGQTSANSSRPPSSDPPQAPPRPKAPPSGRKRGGQPGHRGTFRALLPVEQVDEVVVVVPENCRHCGQPLPAPAGGRWGRVWRHQVVELLPLAVRVTEYQMVRRRCLACGKCTRAELPPGVPRQPFGARLTAVIALLSGRYRLSRREVRQLLQDLWAVRVSLGAVVRQEQAQSAALAPIVEEAQAAVQQADVVNVDETGWREDKQRAWLWTVVTATLTVFRIDRTRSGAAVDALLGAEFAGVVGSDRWSAYSRYPAEKRAICWAHLKRDFQALVDRGGEADPIGRWGLAEIERLFTLWHRFRAGEFDREELQRRLVPLQARLGRLLRRGQENSGRKASGLCRQLTKWWAALWTFARVEGVEPTNNGAERALRPTVLWRKGSFGCDSEAGSRFAERVLTVVATCRQQERGLLDFLVAAGEAAVHGTVAPSLLPSRQGG